MCADVVDDQGATAAEVLTRAAADYETQHARERARVIAEAGDL